MGIKDRSEVSTAMAAAQSRSWRVVCVTTRFSTLSGRSKTPLESHCIRLQGSGGGPAPRRQTRMADRRAPSKRNSGYSIDRIAAALGMDPLEIRMKNAVREGDEHATGQVLKGVGLDECLRKVSRALGAIGDAPDSSTGTKRRGRGIALALIPL